MLTTTIGLVCSEVGILVEEVVVDNKCDVRAQLLVVLLVEYCATNWLTEFEVGVCLLICDNRAVDILFAPPVVPSLAIFILKYGCENITLRNVDLVNFKLCFLRCSIRCRMP